MTLYTVQARVKPQKEVSRKKKAETCLETVNQLFIFSHAQPKLITTQPRGSPGGGTP